MPKTDTRQQAIDGALRIAAKANDRPRGLRRFFTGGRVKGYAEGGGVVDMGLVPPLSNQGDDVGIDGMRLVPPLPTRLPEGLGLQPQSQAEADALQSDARSMAGLLEGIGVAPAYRSAVAAREGRPIAAAGNAAMAMLPYRPLAGLTTLGGAYGGALAADLSPSLSPATAAAQPNPETVRSLTEQAATLQRQVEAARVRREAERRSGQGTRYDAADQEFHSLSSQLTGVNRMLSAEMEKGTPEYQHRAANQQEYDRAVRGAESALGEARRARIPPFRETNVGSLYEATGGVTPAVAGFGASALARLVGRGRPEAIAEGVLAGAVTPNAPLVYDMLTQPTYNPERAMYSAYARDLPPTHPRRQEWTNYAKNLPEDNPARRQASDEFYDPWRAAERTGMGALEGLAAGFPGANLAEGGRWISDSIRSGLGRMPGRQSGAPPPPLTELRPLPGTVVEPPLAQLPAPAPAASPLAAAGSARLAPESAANLNLPAAPQPPVAPLRVRGRNGQVTHHDERGNFTSDPRQPPSGDRPRRGRRPKTKRDEGEDITGHKGGGMVKAAMDIARRYMGGRVGYAEGGAPSVTYSPFGDRYEVEQYQPPTVMGVDPVMLMMSRAGLTARTPADFGRLALTGPAGGAWAGAIETGKNVINRIWPLPSGDVSQPGAAGTGVGAAPYANGGTPRPLPINQGVQPIRPPSGGPNNLDYLRGLRDFYATRSGTVHGSEPQVDARAAYAEGGAPQEPKGSVAGAIVGKTGGRTDALPVSVKSGSFVVPADIVSALGEGNTLAGHEMLDKVFGPQSVSQASQEGAPQPDVPIKISDGEHVISPETVALIGQGDMDRGHEALEQFVLQVRKENVAKLKSLPAPARD